MLNIIAVFVGGGIGSVLRYGICSAISSHWATMCVNLIGAFLIGIAYQYISIQADIATKTKLFIMTGLLGGFTTFSTYLLDFIVLFQNEQKSEAFFYLIASVILGGIMLLAGIHTMRLAL